MRTIAIIALCIQLALPGTAWAACGVGVSPAGMARSTAAAYGDHGITSTGIACCALCELANVCLMNGSDDREPTPEPRTTPNAPTRLPSDLLRGSQPPVYEAWDATPGLCIQLSEVVASRTEIDATWAVFSAASRCAIACVWLT
ncbi:MAG: hypothetical protein AAGK09_04720 [Planctomycetota bacterium]